MPHGQLYYNQIRSGGAKVKTASYTAVDADGFSLIVFNSASAVTFTLPAPPTSALWNVRVLNIGAGTVTLAAGSLTYNGSATMPTFATGVGATIYTDGSNYFGLSEAGGGASGVTSLNGLTGALTLYQGSNVVISPDTPSANDIEIAASGGGGGSGVPWLNTTNPTLTSFTWVNQGTATETVTSGSRILVVPSASPDQLRLRQISASAPPFSVTAAIVPYIDNSLNYSMAGAFVSDGTKLITIHFLPYNNSFVQVNEWNSVSSYASNPANGPNSLYWPSVFFKIYDDGTDLNFLYGPDGNYFYPLYSSARLAWLSSVSYYGFFGDNHSAGGAVGIPFISFATGTS